MYIQKPIDFCIITSYVVIGSYSYIYMFVLDHEYNEQAFNNLKNVYLYDFHIYKKKHIISCYNFKLYHHKLKLQISRSNIPS